VCGKQMYFPFALEKFPKNIDYEMMNEQRIGRVNLELNFQYLSLNYGPNHEGVKAVAVGQVVDDDIDIIKEVGLEIWNNLLFSDEYIEVILENDCEV
ncbi:MAG: hypothetical protein SCJ93_13475, partial [Bacillota bacterium]|nr:hypothetical protein [Bacillota bacterium]